MRRALPSDELLAEAHRLAGPNGLDTRHDRERAKLIGRALDLRAAAGVNRTWARVDLNDVGYWRRP